jgi:hypothetical protein
MGSNFAFNCSQSASSAQYAYDPSKSPADALQTCYRLLNAKCVYLGLDATYCSSSQSTTTADQVLSIQKASYCETYLNITDSILAIVFGALIIVAFLLNAFRIFLRALRGPREVKLDNSESELRMVDTLAQAPLSIPAEEGAKRREHSPDSDSLGMFGRLLPFFGLQWLRAPKASRARQALRLSFLLWAVLVLIPLCFQYQRLYLARFDAFTFLATYNHCASMCSAAGGFPCSQPVAATFNCKNVFKQTSLVDYIECYASGIGASGSLVHSGLAVQLLLLLLPLHSAISCALLWPRPDNPVLLVLHTLRHLSPDRHRQCCAAAMKFTAVLAIFLAVLSTLSSQIVLQGQCNYDTTCPSLNNNLIYPRLICQIFIYAFLSLAPVAMVALFTFTTFIVRIRMRAFVCVAQFVGISMLQQQDGSQSSSSAHAPDSKPSVHEVLTALHLCRCPQHVLSKCRALLLVEGGSRYSDAAAVVQPQMQMIWLMQLREIQLLAKFGEKWLLFQTIFALCLLLPVAAFLSLASQYSSLLGIVLSILQLYFLFCVPFVASILALAIGNFYVQHACDKLALLLQRCSEAAETNADAVGRIFDGRDSLASIVNFCRFTSQDAYCLYGVQINWLSLARFVYYMGLLVWVLSSSLIGYISQISSQYV